MLTRIKLELRTRRSNRNLKASTKPSADIDPTVPASVDECIFKSSAKSFKRVLTLSPGSYPVTAFADCRADKPPTPPIAVVAVTSPAPRELAVTYQPASGVPKAPAEFSLGDMVASSSRTSGPAADLALSVFVLLPASAHMMPSHGPLAPQTRAPPLISRLSGSAVSTLSKLAQSPQTASSDDRNDSSSTSPDMTAANRRLSLAPGMGGGTQTRQPRFSDGFRALSKMGESPGSTKKPQPQAALSPPPFGRQYQISEEPAPTTTSHADLGGSSTAPAFGSRTGTGIRTANGRRRPNTANTLDEPPRAFNQLARSSMALPSGMGLGIGLSGKSRPGWEGDEIVTRLRTNGLEVTVIRNTSHLPSILNPKSSSPRFSSFASSSSSNGAVPTPVILVPLCDSPSLPSLSLLLQQGTTPTAVCFQQDVLDRARRTEEEWLPAALAQIKLVLEMRQQANLDSSVERERPIILAYSANPGLSSTTIASCVDAGASGVLKPPYDAETAKLLRRMSVAAKQGRISSIVGMPTSTSPSPLSPTLGDPDARVILTPTALLGGGQHEGERILERHRRRSSETWDNPSPGATSRDASLSRSAAASRKQSRQELAPLAISVEAANEPSNERHADGIDTDVNSSTFAYYRPGLQRRRRSVDVGGLATAMKRAQKAFDGAAKPGSEANNLLSPAPTYSRDASGFGSNSNGDRHAMTPGPITDKSPASQPDEADTHLAELLSAMFYQACLTIDVQMAEYAELSKPMSYAHRTRLIDALATWNFKPHHLDDGDLYRVACLMFEGILHIEGVKELELPRERFNCLLFAIRAIYHAPNPYHNYIHAIDVLQATYTFLIDVGVAPPWDFLRDLTPDTPAWQRPDESALPVHGLGTRRAREVLRPQDVLAVIVAAMGHDVGHPGLSNAFMKNAKTPLSEVYDDKSVLENMHCMLVVQLLRKHGFGCLLSPTEAKSCQSSPARKAFDSKGFRKVLYSSILATDMSLHFAWIAQLKQYGERVEIGDIGTKTGEEGEREEEFDRIMLCQAFIKCADISNPTRPIDVSEHWSTVLLEEWAKQASLETDLSLPVSVIASADQALQAKGQIGFIDLFTQPLFEAVSDVVPELQRYADSCAQNRGLWATRLETLQQHDSTPLVQPMIAGASVDERFRTLFPLSLPMSLVSLSCLEPGPVPQASSALPTTPVRQTQTQPNKLGTPKSASSYSFGAQASSGSYSPTAKAMRAVYHANLLDQRHRLAKEDKGVPIPGVHILMDAARRSSTPDGALFSSTEPGRFDRRFLRA